MSIVFLLISLLSGSTGLAAAPTTDGVYGDDRPNAPFCSVADSIFALTDIAELERVVDIAQHGANRVNPEANARAGIAAFRLARAMEEWLSLERALDFLLKADYRYEEDPCYLYYRGVVRRERRATQPFSPNPWHKAVPGENADNAIKDFRRAAQLQPTWFAPVAAMAELALTAFEGRAGRRPRWREWTFEALDAYTEAGGDAPEASLWRGRMLMELDSLASALAAFRFYDALTNSGMAHLEKARVLFTLGENEEATQMYWRAVQALSDSSVAAEMGRDLHYIFDPLETVEWNHLETGAQRTAWVQHFWSRRCAADLVTDEERLAEHYARLHHARLNYRRFKWGRHPVSQDLFDVPDDETLDDRGVVYVRLGRPADDVICSATGEMPPEFRGFFNNLRSMVFNSDMECRTWFYQAPDGHPTALHFTSGGSADWYLITLLPIESYWRLGRYDPYFYSLGWREASRMLQGIRSDPSLTSPWGGWLGTMELRQREREFVEREVNKIVVTDRMGLALDYDMEFGYEWLFFQGADPGTVEATLALAVPQAEEISCLATDPAGRCTLRLRSSIFARDSVVNWDDAFPSFEFGEDDGATLYGHKRMTVTPGAWSYRMALFEPVRDSGEPLHGNWAGGQVTVPALVSEDEPHRVTVSSLVVARPGTGGWTRAGEALALNPLHTYPTGATVELYYEIYGLRQSEVFFTELLLLEGDPPLASIDPPGDWIDSEVRGGQSALQLRFEETASYQVAPWVQRRKTLTLSDIRPGRYTLVLAITLSDLSTTIYRATPILVQPATD